MIVYSAVEVEETEEEDTPHTIAELLHRERVQSVSAGHQPCRYMVCVIYRMRRVQCHTNTCCDSDQPDWFVSMLNVLNWRGEGGGGDHYY